MIRRELRLHQLTVVLKYLTVQGCTNGILEQCLSSRRSEVFGVMPITIHVDLMRLAEMDREVASLITCRPMEGTMLFREVVHEMLVEKGLLPSNMDASQLAVSLRFTAATLPDLSWANGQTARYNGLIKLRGIVQGVTAIVSYTKSTKYSCPKEDCEGHNSNQYIRIHVPGASEQDTVGRKFRCCVCGTRLTEIKSRRSLSEKLLAEVKAVHSAAQQDVDTKTGYREQTVAVIVRDDLCGSFQLGQHYEMIGIQRVSFEADSIITMFEIQDDCKAGLLAKSLPPRLQLLIARWQSTPFVLSHLLAFYFAASVCPPNCFFKLKLLLLISLVITSEIPPLHVLSICKETDLIQRLMDVAATLAVRNVTHTSLHVLGARVTTSRYPWAPYFVQAGSLVLGTGGICKVGDLKALKKSCRQELQTALNENRIQVALEARFTGGLPRVLSLPLSCHVWGILSNSTAPTSTSSSVATSAFSYGATGAATESPPALLDAFSIVSQNDTGLSSSVDVTEDLVSHILTADMALREESPDLPPFSVSGGKVLSSSSEGFDYLTLEDFRKFVQAARSLRSVMTVEAEWLLTSYLIAARYARAHTSQSSHGTPVPLTAWNSLQALAHGICRLSLRAVVAEEDALMAIFLYEEALTARHGISALNIFPEPHLPAVSAVSYITTQLGPEMHKFRSRLLSFCAGSSVSPNSEE